MFEEMSQFLVTYYYVTLAISITILIIMISLIIKFNKYISSWACPECGIRNLNRVTKCQRCGFSNSPTILPKDNTICPHCHSITRSDIDICAYCGKPLKVEQNTGEAL